MGQHHQVIKQKVNSFQLQDQKGSKYLDREPSKGNGVLASANLFRLAMHCHLGRHLIALFECGCMVLNNYSVSFCLSPSMCKLGVIIRVVGSTKMNQCMAVTGTVLGTA